MSNTNPPEEFGKDLGLMHELARAGRKAGMDRTAWSALAHNKKLLAQVAELAKQSLEVSADDRAAVEQWIAKTAGAELPYREQESYYPRSSHSNYPGFLQNTHDAMKELFWKAQHNEKARDLCKEIEVLFVLAYCYSALHMAVHEPEINTVTEERWFHTPLFGFLTTFDDVLTDGGRTCPGWFNTTEYFRANQAACTLQIARRTIKTDSNAVRELYDVCRAARDEQKQKVLQLITAGVQ